MMLTPSMEDYLEQIYLITQQKGYVRTIEIAERLHVRSASVSQMIRKLDESGFVRYEKFRCILLTSKGLSLGKDLAEKHNTLRNFYRMIGVRNKEAEEEIKQIKHFMSKDTVAHISRMLQLHFKGHDGGI